MYVPIDQASISPADFHQQWGWHKRQLADRDSQILEAMSLHTGDTATTLAVFSIGETLIKDGPISSDAAGLDKVFVVEAEDLDGALHTAAVLLGSRRGAIEIRPVIPSSIRHDYP